MPVAVARTPAVGHAVIAGCDSAAEIDMAPGMPVSIDVGGDAGSGRAAGVLIGGVERQGSRADRRGRGPSAPSGHVLRVGERHDAVRLRVQDAGAALSFGRQCLSRRLIDRRPELHGAHAEADRVTGPRGRPPRRSRRSGGDTGRLRGGHSGLVRDDQLGDLLHRRGGGLARRRRRGSGRTGPRPSANARAKQ